MLFMNIYIVFIYGAVYTYVEMQYLPLIDSVVTAFVMIYLISILYSFKDTLFYSSEGIYTHLYKKMGIDKYTILTSKLRLVYVLFIPVYFGLFIGTLLFTPYTSITHILYGLISLLFKYFIVVTVIDHVLLSDTLFPRKFKYSRLAGLGNWNLSILCAMVPITIGTVSYSEYLPKSLTSIPNIGVYLLCIFTVVIMIIFIVQKIKINKLKNVLEEERIYG